MHVPFNKGYHLKAYVPFPTPKIVSAFARIFKLEHVGHQDEFVEMILRLTDIVHMAAGPLNDFHCTRRYELCGVCHSCSHPMSWNWAVMYAMHKNHVSGSVDNYAEITVIGLHGKQNFVIDIFNGNWPINL